MFTVTNKIRTLIALGAVGATVGSTAVASAATVGATVGSTAVARRPKARAQSPVSQAGLSRKPSAYE
jgi:hypothetical protein